MSVFEVGRGFDFEGREREREREREKLGEKERAARERERGAVRETREGEGTAKQPAGVPADNHG